MKNYKANNKEDMNSILKELRAKVPAGFFPREAVDELTCGALSARYLSNLDCKGEGPPAFYLGRKRCYWVESFFDWMLKRTQKTNGHGGR